MEEELINQENKPPIEFYRKFGMFKDIEDEEVFIEVEKIKKEIDTFNFLDLSEIQKVKYKDICGCKHIPGTLGLKFNTKTPDDDNSGKWSKYSPWFFKFQFHSDTGYLFCWLGHRMTNSQSFGWDYEGNELSSEIVDEVYEAF